MIDESDINKDFALITWWISVMKENQWVSGSHLQRNLHTQYSKNIVISLGVDNLNKDDLQSLLNLLEISGG